MSTVTTPAERRETQLPPLENGDRLNRQEFERRYAAMPNAVKAELIDRVVYMASPARHQRHGKQQSRLNGFFLIYMVATPGTDVGDNSSLRLNDENEPQPDGLLRIVEEAGGNSTLDAEGYLQGGPELIGEIAASSVSYDLGPKLEVYRRHRVLEYIVWRVLESAIDWFVLRDGDYDRLSPDENGTIKSQNFPGLWMNVPSMLSDDMAAVQDTLQKGLASEEHQRFVAELAARIGSAND